MRKKGLSLLSSLSSYKVNNNKKSFSAETIHIAASQEQVLKLKDSALNKVKTLLNPLSL
jgi:hypothetical protein